MVFTIIPKRLQHFSAEYNMITLASQSTTHALIGIRNFSNGALQISNNTFSFSFGVASSGSCYYIMNEPTSGSASNFTFSNNSFAGTLNTTGTIYFFYNINSQQSPAIVSIQNNWIAGTLSRTATSGGVYLYYNNGTSTGTEIISGNNFQNISQSGSSAFYGIYSYPDAGCSHQVYNNTISGITSGTGYFQQLTWEPQPTETFMETRSVILQQEEPWMY